MKCGLLGRRLGHSYSPAIHTKLGNYSYELLEREPEQVETLLKSGGFDGLNVTIPYKKTVLTYLDRIDDAAKKLGNVNTIVQEADGSLTGHNTDYYGFAQTVRFSGLSVTGKKVLVLGTGGASMTVCAVLRDLGAQVIQISRTGENNYQNLSRHADARVIVNTTPVGMYPKVLLSPVDLRQFPQLEGVLDLIYNPARTRLILDAERLGIPAWNGLRMLVAQAKQAAEFFTGNRITDSRMDAILREIRFSMENIVLIGMAGCGKSTVGQLLAQKLGRKFVDCDAEIELLAGKSIPDLFAQEGEEAFRSFETQVLDRFGMESGLVLATGGGCVTKECNYRLLHQNGTIVWIQRDAELLPTEGRPLSQKTAPALLYRQRIPLYQTFSDCAVENTGTPEETADRILAILEEQS